MLVNFSFNVNNIPATLRGLDKRAVAPRAHFFRLHNLCFWITVSIPVHGLRPQKLDFFDHYLFCPGGLQPTLSHNLPLCPVSPPTPHNLPWGLAWSLSTVKWLKCDLAWGLSTVKWLNYVIWLGVFQQWSGWAMWWMQYPLRSSACQSAFAVIGLTHEL